MNEILQKRIEEAAEEYANSTTSNLLNVFETTGRFEGFEQGATFTLQNQWISVEEDLPKKDEDGSDTSIYVLVTDSTNPFGYIWKAYYDFTIKDWYNAMSCENLAKQNITHWMEIPSLEGGEK